MYVVLLSAPLSAEIVIVSASVRVTVTFVPPTKVTSSVPALESVSLSDASDPLATALIEYVVFVLSGTDKLIPPAVFEIVTLPPFVSVASVYPVPLPINSCPFDGAVLKPVPPFATAKSVPDQSSLLILSAMALLSSLSLSSKINFFFRWFHV